MKSIIEELKQLNDSDLYPFHMPGHKRNQTLGAISDYVDIDITEIDGYDNLHDASGIIKEAQLRANKLYFDNRVFEEEKIKTKESNILNTRSTKEEARNKALKLNVAREATAKPETFFLVNGSTSGVLAAVSAAVSDGGRLLTARNAHKSLYNAAYLRRLQLLFLSPKEMIIDGCGVIPGTIDVEEVEKYLIRDNDIEAVFITSPTYEGISTDISEIAQICHSFNKILIVDAAHGAHFGLYEELPPNAVSQEADIVIHSVHKTLSSMTQTALLHVQGALVNRDRLRRFLRIYQSSSPSYVLMASIDSCIRDIEKRGNVVFKTLIDYRNRIQKETEKCKYLYIPDLEYITDPCKVLVCARNGSVTGQEIYDILRVEYRLQPEMAGDFYALMIITGYDSKQGIDRLIKAINDIDFKIGNSHIWDNEKEQCNFFKKTDEKNDVYNAIDKDLNKDIITDVKKNISKDLNKDICKDIGKAKYPNAIIPIYEALDAEHEMVDLAFASDRVSGEFVNLYPPGTPLIVPGEAYTEDLLVRIDNYINAGMNVQGVLLSEDNDRKVIVLKNTDKYGKDI